MGKWRRDTGKKWKPVMEDWQGFDLGLQENWFMEALTHRNEALDLLEQVYHASCPEGTCFYPDSPWLKVGAFLAKHRVEEKKAAEKKGRWKSFTGVANGPLVLQSERDEALDLLEIAHLSKDSPGYIPGSNCARAFLDGLREEPRMGYRLIDSKGEVVWDSEGSR